MSVVTFYTNKESQSQSLQIV